MDNDSLFKGQHNLQGQYTDNLPLEIYDAPRFFLTRGKIPQYRNWNNPDNQFALGSRTIFNNGYNVGFDICGHGKATDYLVLDFDHVLGDTGRFVNSAAQKWYNLIAQAGTYCEKSISGHGLHFIFNPAHEDFHKMASGSSARLDLGDGACIEIFYLPAGRFFLLTGDVYNCAPQTPISTDCDVIYILLDEIRKGNPPRKATYRNHNINLDDLQKALDTILFDAKFTYFDWRNIGMALHADLGDNDAAFNMWRDFSARDDRLDSHGKPQFNESKMRYTWDHFHDIGEDLVHVGTIFYIAKRYGYQPTSADSADTSDFANAQRLFDFCRDNLRYLYDADKWAVFDGHKWGIALNANAAPLYKYALELGKASTDEKIAATFASTRKINAAITLIKGIGDAIITRDDLNRHPQLLNCKNGVVDLQTKRLYPSDPALLLTQMINAQYRADSHNEVVNNFLRDIMPDEDTRAALLRFLGYCLTGEVSEEKALIFNGVGGNGKGTLTGTLLNLFGDYGTPFPVGAVLANKFSDDDDANAPTPAYNKLIDTRLAISEEIPQGRKISAAKFKLLTGGDRIPIRRLHEEATQIERPTHKLIISGNYLPELQDAADAGIIRRLMNIRFTQTFDDKTRDINLKKKIITPDALSGLFSLLVDNAAQWYSDGLLESADMTTAKKTYLEDQDFISTFLDEYCVFGVGKSIKMQTLIDKLRLHCGDETKFMTDKALRPMMAQVLARRQGVQRSLNRQHVVVFIGVDYRDDEVDFDEEEEVSFF